MAYLEESDGTGVRREALVTAFGFVALTAGLWHWTGMPPEPLLVAYAGCALLTYMVAAKLAGERALGPANRVTLYRALGVVILAGVVTEPSLLGRVQWGWVSLALAVLILDALDGYLARRCNASSHFGARFDMEVDAALILTLCLGVWVLGITGPWVLLLGLMRYAFIAAGWIWPRINRPLPESLRRKTICVWQTASLVVVLVPVTPSWLAIWILALALALLATSFTVDLAWLCRSGGHHEGNRRGTET